MKPPVRSVKNQYRGVNAHLHSFWQGTGTWNRFHNVHITHLMEALRAQLLPMGYTAEIEESLQIRRFGGDIPRRPKSDVMIYDSDPRRAKPLATVASVPELTVAELIEEEDAEHPYSALAIYPMTPSMEFGEAVAWIELLSPSNKGNTDDAYAYIGKRRALLESGMVFVEMDYLHESPPTFARLPDYTDAHNYPDAHPYRIIVLDPRPTLQQGPAGVYEFDVDEVFPTTEIPLTVGESIHFDFAVPYQRMFEQGYYGYHLDYAELPMNFDRYSEADQTRIARRMLAVLEASQAGIDLESAPLEMKDIPLQEALAKIEQFKHEHP